jgi:uncharacterized protein YcnI
MRKISTLFLALMLSMLLLAGIASAHVVVYPKDTIQGSYEKFTVRVPTEKDIPTVKVEIKVPPEVEVSRTMPVPGWKAEFTKDANGKVISIIWTTTGEGLSSTEFGEFDLQGKVDKAAAALVWKADQTYKDGSVVNWAGDEKSDHPASVTKVNPVPANASVAPDGDLETSTTSSSKLPLYLSIAAVIIALLSLILTFIRKRI